jgi:dolichyl-phosphate-mannose-protein mannosyltransferase
VENTALLDRELQDESPADTRRKKCAPATCAKEAAIVFLISLVFLLIHISTPQRKIFDERYYTAGVAMFHGQPDANPEHPPMGKYLIALGISAAGDNPIGWRLMPAIFGSLLLAVVFVWMWELGRHAAWTAVALIAANGFWFVLSRVAMLCIFELTFTILGLYLLNQRKYWLSGVALGLAIACRWNALFALLLVMGYAAYDDGVKSALKVWVSSVCAYVAAWIPIVGLHPARFVQAQFYIWNYHRHFDVGCPTLRDNWYHWLVRTIPENGLDHMLANPLVTGMGIIAVLILLRRGNIAALAATVFLLQWAITPRKVTYYYYYLNTLTMMSIAVAIVAGRYKFKLGSRTVRLCVPVAMLSAVWFITHYAAFIGLEAPYDTLFQF